ATELAQLMAGEYGMSERLGKVSLVRSSGSEFLGGVTTPTEMTTGVVLAELHAEVRRLVEEAENQAVDILTRHRSLLVELAPPLPPQPGAPVARCTAPPIPAGDSWRRVARTSWQSPHPPASVAGRPFTVDPWMPCRQYRSSDGAHVVQRSLDGGRTWRTVF